MKELSRAEDIFTANLVKELERLLRPGDTLTIRRHSDDPTRKEFVVTVRTFGDGNSSR